MSETSFDKEKLLEEYQPDFAMAYGSGVFKQEGYTDEDKPMIDFVFGVKDPLLWHKRNLETHGNDYSFLARLLGPRFIRFLQDRAAKIYYNPFVDFDGGSIKYGVISQEDLINDLQNWTHLYVAGRMHKPVHILKSNPDVDSAIQANFNHALTTALMLLPHWFLEEDLYMAIAGLSYTGDSRMGIAEHPDKVANIVKKNLEGFRNIYEPIIEARKRILVEVNDGTFEQDMDPKVQRSLYQDLPRNLKLVVEKR